MWKVVFATDQNDRPLGKSRFDYYRKNQPQAFAKLRQRLTRVVDCLNNGLPEEVALGFGLWLGASGKERGVCNRSGSRLSVASHVLHSHNRQGKRDCLYNRGQKTPAGRYTLGP